MAKILIAGAGGALSEGVLQSLLKTGEDIRIGIGSDHYKGRGDFIAAEMPTSDTITWLSILHDCELVVAQSGERRGCTYGNRSISGGMGVTKARCA